MLCINVGTNAIVNYMEDSLTTAMCVQLVRAALQIHQCLLGKFYSTLLHYCSVARHIATISLSSLVKRFVIVVVSSCFVWVVRSKGRKGREGGGYYSPYCNINVKLL